MSASIDSMVAGIQTITIPKTNIEDGYGGEKVFHYASEFERDGKVYRAIVRDNHVVLKKNILPTLQMLASHAGVKGYSKLRKPQLVELLSRIYVFEV
jgi:hypothetical protein